MLVGLSGGADSTALLLVLDSLKALLGIKLIAVHVNHGIRAEAGEDAIFSQELCDRLDVPFFLIEKDIHEGKQRNERRGNQQSPKAL